MTEREPGIEAWKERTSAFDRVRSVAQTVTEPRSASWIAERAAVAENTARDHLERLVEMNVLLSVDAEGTTAYQPDPLHTRLQTLRELLDEYDRDGLIELKAELQTRIEDWQARYEVESPADLRDRASETDRAAETATIREVAGDWELTEHRLEIVEAAIRNYATYSRGDAASA